MNFFLLKKSYYKINKMGVRIINKKSSTLTKEATKIDFKIASLKFEFDLTTEEINSLIAGLKGLKLIIERNK